MSDPQVSLEDSMRLLEGMILEFRQRELVPRGMDGLAPRKIIEEAEEFAQDPSLDEAADVLITLLAETMVRDLGGLAAIIAQAVRKMRRNLDSDFVFNDSGTLRRVCRTCRNHDCTCTPEDEGDQHE